MFSPDLPGYFPTMLVAVRSKSVAPSSVQMAWTNMVLPVPLGAARSRDFMCGLFSRRCVEPIKINLN